MESLTIDGSLGEGGGQILRTSLALSLVTGRAVRIVNIRAGRKKPGLGRQHLTAVNAAARIGQAEVCGAHIGSGELVFAPKRPLPGEYHFDVGTAGSTTLVLQTVLPALLTADGPSVLTLGGGTHNPFAPPFDFLAKTFLPLINRMGPKVEACLDRPGFYPAGGGRITVRIDPAVQLKAFEMLKCGAITYRSAKVLLAKLPRHIAERELQVIESELGWPPEFLSIDEVKNSPGPGNVIMIEIGSPEVTEVFTAFGERGVRAEAVAKRVVGQVRRYLAADVPVGEHLADQLLLPLALAGGGAFTTTAPTLHTKTNVDVIQRFLNVKMTSQAVSDSAWRIAVGCRSAHISCEDGSAHERYGLEEDK